ncbi:hypothetical protein BDW59DRAFT_177773 [Aspergillus cavernicola]|uniref:Zn(2)-C6 fungal-type domain-containing protein n=1 Tax=Aspergillus cavernicola TaxID=176166 RepID=A0ABR4HHS5_9EURO
MTKKKKACTECRQQKAKCDVYLNPEQPCSRCRKVKAHCVVSDPFKRESKRQRLSQLQDEVEELRRRPTRSADPGPSLDTHIGVQEGVQEEVQPTPVLPGLAPVGFGPSTPGPTSAAEGDAVDRTTPRMLNGVEVTGEEIDDLFQIFFRHYAPFLPILDPQTRPNTYYAQSPLLFWSVIGVSCRMYPQNPTLLTALAQSIIQMALLSVASASPAWHTIQAFLLLLTWALPKEGRPDVTFPMSGMMLHIAMQNGLHIPVSSNEFSSVKISPPSEAVMVRRAELWAHCVFVYQRACVMKGQSLRAVLRLAQDPGQHQVIFDKVFPSLVLKIKCQGLVAQCSEAVLKNGVRDMSLDQEHGLDILLRIYEGQMDELELQAVNDDERFHCAFCRVAIQTFHFYKNQTMISSGCLTRLLATMCHMVDSTQTMADRLDCISMAPIQVCYGLLLASASLLRILKSAAAQSLDFGRARSSLFLAINLAKQMSVENTDTPAKIAIILKQLWNSSKAFRKADGSEYTALRIRSRLAHSLVIDTVWWWRDEFDPQTRDMILTRTDPDSATVLPHARSFPNQDTGSLGPNLGEPLGIQPTTILAEGQEAFSLDELFLADFDWALGDGDALFAAEPISTTWPTTSHLL